MKKHFLITVIVVILIGVAGYFFYQRYVIHDFDSCVRVGGVNDHDDNGASFCRINGENHYFRIPKGAVN